MILDVAPLELMILGGVALLVIPPKDLPRAMRFAGQWVGRARGLARQFRSGFDDMIREAEFAEMEKKWKAENERIMREFPQASDFSALPAPESTGAAASGTEAVEADAPVMVAQPVIAPEPASPAMEAAAEPHPEPEPQTKPVKRRARAATSGTKSRTAAADAAPRSKAAPRAKAEPSPASGE